MSNWKTIIFKQWTIHQNCMCFICEYPNTNSYTLELQPLHPYMRDLNDEAGILKRFQSEQSFSAEQRWYRQHRRPHESRK